MKSITIDTTTAETALEALHGMGPMLGRASLRCENPGQKELAEMADEMARAATAIQLSLDDVVSMSPGHALALTTLGYMASLDPATEIPWQTINEWLEVGGVEYADTLFKHLEGDGLVVISRNRGKGDTLRITTAGLEHLGRV